MASIQELRAARLKKLEELRRRGIDPYPAQSFRTHTAKKAADDFENLSASRKEIFLTGRIRSIRAHGGITFMNIEDESGRMQLFFKKDFMEEDSYKNIELLDIGDFIEARGRLFLTKKEEKTLEVSGWKILTKSIRPIPEERFGLKNEEQRLRKRYLDILSNPDVKEMIYKKSKFWGSMREFLVNEGFLEVETPVLETTTGGADARPFTTHHNALDMDVYLRISAGELWQKRLMVAGFEKTFEIGTIFRNEGMDAEHLQAYTQMEFYWAYANYKMAMELTEKMFKYVAEKTFGTLKFKIRGFDIDLNKKWEMYDYQNTVKEYTGVDILNTNLEEIEAKLKELNIEYDKNGFNITRGIDNLWKYCRAQIGGPGFLIREPLNVSPLAKKDKDNPNVVQRFHVVIGGSELLNGYSELNDPIDQAERFSEQAKLRESGDEEAQMNDRDFVEALEYGMPPTAGVGLSERVFAFLMDKPIRECQIFPLVRAENNKVI